MTFQQVRECISELLIDERLKVCDQDQFNCFRCTHWLNRNKQSIKNRKNAIFRLVSYLISIGYEI
jgi:hypothetical protein